MTAATAGTAFEALVAKAIAGKDEDDVAFIRSVGVDKTFGPKVRRRTPRLPMRGMH